MRLICPNCDAQYEIPDDVIPTSGRDVQCSNCGTTWFQHHPTAHEPEPEAAQQPDDEMPADPQETAAAAQVTDPDQAEPDVTSWDGTSDDSISAIDSFDDEFDDWEEDPALSQPGQRRTLDPKIAGLLREEATREAQQRATERGGLETQAELGLAASAAAPAAAPVDRTQPRDPKEAMRPAPSRRELLPDIEEINSTLRSSSESRSLEDGAGSDPTASKNDDAKAGHGFRNGFLLMILLAVLAIATYVYSPKIAQAIPQAQSGLTTYVDGVNDARSWLSGQVNMLLSKLDTMSSEATETTEEN